MGIDFKKEQNKLIANLEAIFNSVSMKTALLQSNLQSIIEKQLNILFYLENTNQTKTIKSDKLLNKYNEITNKHFTIDKNIKYADQDALIDDINYLGVYIRNIYKVDLAALIEGKESKVVVPTVSDAPQTPKPAVAIPFMFPGMGNNNLSPEQNPMYAAMANARIQQESMQGKVYLFKTKPKSIPMLKWIISALLILFAFACVFVGVGMLCSKNSQHAMNQGTDFNNALSLWTTIFYFVLALVAGWLCYRTIKTLMNAKNENAIYSFQWQFYLMFGVLFVMLIIFGGSMGPDFYIFRGAMVPWSSPTEASNYAFGLWSWFIGYVLLFISAVSLTGCIILGSVIGPKVDVERLNALTRQYIEEAMKAPPNPG